MTDIITLNVRFFSHEEAEKVATSLPEATLNGSTVTFSVYVPSDSTEDEDMEYVEEAILEIEELGVPYRDFDY